MKVFITGGTSGIGVELAKLYLDQGDDVAVCGRDLSKLDLAFDSLPAKLKSYHVDVSQSAELKAAIDDFAQNGGIDLLIASAGISVGGMKKSLPDFEACKKVLQVNTLGVWDAFSYAAPYMLKQKKGHLVAVSSVAGFVGLPGAAAYSASKAAVTTFCESFRMDLKPYGINVTTICPGFIDTPLTQKNKHAMPFLMSAQKAATLIKRAIDNNRALYIFPLPMKLAITFLNKLPRGVYRKLMTFKLFNYSKQAKEGGGKSK